MPDDPIFILAAVVAGVMAITVAIVDIRSDRAGRSRAEEVAFALAPAAAVAWLIYRVWSA